MKKAHNVYTEDRAWTIAREESLNFKDILKVETTRHPNGSASALADMAIKYVILLSNPGKIHNKEIDWSPGIKLAKMHGLPLSKYVSQMI